MAKTKTRTKIRIGTEDWNLGLGVGAGIRIRTRAEDWGLPRNRTNNWTTIKTKTGTRIKTED